MKCQATVFSVRIPIMPAPEIKTVALLGCSRERDQVPDIRHAGDIVRVAARNPGRTPRGARCRSGVDPDTTKADRSSPAFLELLVEHIKAFFTLTATNNFAGAWNQHVHGGNRLAVVVAAHVESLDVLRVVHDHDGPSHVLLGEIAFVFGLQVQSPFNRKLETLVGALENVDGFAVVHARKF